MSCDYRIGSIGPFKYGLNETAIDMAPLPVFGIELALPRLSPGFLSRAFIQSEMFSPNYALEEGFLDQIAVANDLFEIGKSKTLELSSLP